MLPKHLGRSGASVRVRSGTGGLEDRSAADYTSLAWSWLRESNPFGAPYQGAPRPTATSIVESLGNAPSRSACKAEQQPSASDPVAGLPRIVLELYEVQLSWAKYSESHGAREASSAKRSELG
jgi:hypothetical protein